MRAGRVLLAITEDPTLTQVSAILERQGFDITHTPLESEMVGELLRPVDLLVVGMNPERAAQAIDTIRRARSHDEQLPILAIATEKSEALVVGALRSGATDYLSPPHSAEALDAAIERCLRRRDAPPAGGSEDRAIVGVSPRMRELRAQIARLAANDSNVLITGETGTGKELAAQSLHRNGNRRRKPFICVNCAAIPDGLLESELFGFEEGAFTGANRSHEGKLQLADGGTLFFDEIGEMSPFAQAKILRAIETKEVYPIGCRRPVRVDFRIIAATNRSLEWLSGEGTFRKDLFFRLNVGHIHLPPLRDRPSDIPLLIARCVAEFNRRFRRNVAGFEEEAMRALASYHWPGNVRELRNVVEAAFVNLPLRQTTVLALPERLRDACGGAAPAEERERLMQMLLVTNWNISKAAERLQWSRMTVYRKLAKYQLVRHAAAKSA